MMQDTYYKNIRNELNSFYSDGPVLLGQLNRFCNPDELEMIYSGFDEDSDKYEIYTEKLLPDFIAFSQRNHFDIVNFNKQTSKEKFSALLAANVEGFNDYKNIVIYNDFVYFLRYTRKDIRSLPHNLSEKELFLESEQIFTYDYYKISREGFFKLVLSYVNLHEEYEKVSSQNSNLKITLFISALIALGIVILMFG